MFFTPILTCQICAGCELDTVQRPFQTMSSELRIETYKVYAIVLHCDKNRTTHTKILCVAIQTTTLYQYGLEIIQLRLWLFQKVHPKCGRFFLAAFNFGWKDTERAENRRAIGTEACIVSKCIKLFDIRKFLTSIFRYFAFVGGSKC